jgi:hypothetical protein
MSGEELNLTKLKGEPKLDVLKPSKDDFSYISTPKDEEDYLQSSFDGTIQQGLNTGFEELDPFFKFKRGNLVIMNGHDNVGKSTIIWYLSILANLLHGWRWIFFTAENRDASVRKRLIEFKYGKDYDKLNLEQIKEGKAWAYENFIIIKSENVENYETLCEKIDSIMTMCDQKGKQKPSGLLVDPYNALDISLSDPKFKGLSTHDFHYKATTAFRIIGKKYDCATYVNCHAVTQALRNLDAEGYPVAPNKADTEGGGKFGNRADDFITLHRKTQHPEQYNYTEIHVRKIKETETGGKPTPLGFPVALKLDNIDGWFGFFDKYGKCPLQEIYNKRNNLEQKELKPVNNNDFGDYDPDSFLGRTKTDEAPF